MDEVPQHRSARPCPICGKPAPAKFKPFCSERCAMVDLGRWLGGGYRVPTDEKPDEAGNPPRDDDGDDAPDGGRGA
jgi:endogenous inhibitor of DNA gyrase (YacG/DUF329 family)